MQYSSAVLEAVITELTRLPGLGRKSAQRIAFHLLRSSEGDARKLAQAILDLKSRVEDCRVCGNVTETQPCAICADPRRDPSILCVVEQPMDVLALERTGLASAPERYLAQVGVYSYSLYLLHRPIQLVFEPLAREAAAWPGLDALGAPPGLLVMAATTPLVLWASRLFYRCVEAPSIRRSQSV